MLRMDFYQHLNEGDKFCIEIDIEAVATKIVSMNYGVHRLLSSIVRQRLALVSHDELAHGILMLLERGLF